MADPGPKRVFEGVAQCHDDHSQWWSIDDDDGINLTGDVVWFDGLHGKRVRLIVEDLDAPLTSPARTHRGTVNLSRDDMNRVIDVYLDTPIGLVSVLEPFVSFAGKRVELTVRLIDEDGGGNG
jgi:hypothetical protein